MSIFSQCMKSMKDGGIIPIMETPPQNILIPAKMDKHAYSTVPSLVREKNKNESFDYVSKTVFYISDIHLFHHVLMKYPDGATDEQIKNYIKEFVENMLTTPFKKDFSCVLIGGDVSHSFQLSTLFYTELSAQLDALAEKYNRWGYVTQFQVYAVLGNHELWDFQTIEECQNAYKKMLEPLNITLLCNECALLSFRRPQRYLYRDNETKRYIYEDIDPEKEPDAFDRALIGSGNMVIVGGTGFAEFNERYNADAGLYRHVLNRQREIAESEKWREVYAIGLKEARRIRGQLIVLTHNPMQDWMGTNFEGDPNCIYFSGHNHNNFLYHNDEENVHIYANNQIGYKNKGAKLRKAALYTRRNPFAGLPDGIHEIKSHDYLEFYAHMGEWLQGNGTAERLIEKCGCKFYMIKKSGYYGFFLVSDEASYICAGGHVKKISNRKDIGYYFDNFDTMISMYINKLSPYRRAQEEIAAAVRQIGGEGKIHGCIIDINFYNHIMLNPYDGSLTFYYSPTFGQIQAYHSIGTLLEAHIPALFRKYMTIGQTALDIYKPEDALTTEGLVEVDKKDGMYGLSKKVNQIQRLFSCRVLRDWNDSLIEKEHEVTLPLKSVKSDKRLEK